MGIDIYWKTKQWFYIRALFEQAIKTLVIVKEKKLTANESPTRKAQDLPLEKERSCHFFIILYAAELFPAVHYMRKSRVIEFLHHSFRE